MSDFLSKFSGDKYDELLKEDAQASQPVEQTPSSDSAVFENPAPSEVPEQPVLEEAPDGEPAQPESVPTEPPKDDRSSDIVTPPPTYVPPEPKKTKPTPPKSLDSSRRSTAEDTVVDPTYQNKRKRQYIIGGIIGTILLLLAFFLWYQMNHVRIPDFEGKTLSEARVWGARNKIEFVPTMVFSKEFPETQVIRQDPAPDRKIRKGTEVEVDVSKGPDPDERLPLPDFANLNYEEAQQWVQQEKATGVSLILQYDALIPRYEHLKTEFRSPDVTEDNYQRKDAAIVYYSRGEEQFEKNINVPDFSRKAKAEVDSWASTNGIKVTYNEQTSSNVDQGFIISQSISSGTKIARNDEFSVTVSLGEAIIVPDYTQYSPEEASQVSGMMPLIMHRYNSWVPYGSLVSQSLPAGTELTDQDDKSIKLVYSLGLPYLEDMRGVKNEGELQQYFFDTYRAKGANVTYITEYDYSDMPKGMVIEQSSFARLVPLDYVVKITISLGNGDGNYDPLNPNAPVPTVPGGPDFKN